MYKGDLTKESISFLRNKNIRPSVIRTKVLSYLMSTKEHPSAETIYKKLAEEIPTLSKSSVYNTLKLLVENGLALEINIDEKESRFDGDTSVHGHFLCLKCRKLEDIELLCKGKCAYEKNESRIIITHQVLFYGYCRNCKDKKS
ncbi:MAG: transcriptional repressor [Chitinispirillaceae bacterium]|nr:transcriptional repressor [Chitinispirillaceae bacterium]